MYHLFVLIKQTLIQINYNIFSSVFITSLLLTHNLFTLFSSYCLINIQITILSDDGRNNMYFICLDNGNVRGTVYCASKCLNGVTNYNK